MLFAQNHPLFHQFIGYLRKQDFIGGKPGDGAKVVEGEPPGGFVFVEVKGVGAEGAEVAVKGDVEGGVVVVEGMEESVHLDFGGEFFAYFANQGLLGALAGLEFAARKFPEVFVFAVAALCGENLIALSDDSGCHFNAFHTAKFANVSESAKFPYLRVMATYYQHFKGGKYRLLYVAKDSETLEKMVVYQALYGEKGVWVRPYEMFFGKVERDGRVFDRFSPISEEEALADD